MSVKGKRHTSPLEQLLLVIFLQGEMMEITNIPIYFNSEKKIIDTIGSVLFLSNMGEHHLILVKGQKKK